MQTLPLAWVLNSGPATRGKPHTVSGVTGPEGSLFAYSTPVKLEHGQLQSILRLGLPTCIQEFAAPPPEPLMVNKRSHPCGSVSLRRLGSRLRPMSSTMTNPIRDGWSAGD